MEPASRSAAGEDVSPSGTTPLKGADEQLDTIRRMAAEGAKVATIARVTGLTRPTVYSYLPARASA